jgi:hypothetical protein
MGVRRTGVGRLDIQRFQFDSEDEHDDEHESLFFPSPLPLSPRGEYPVQPRRGARGAPLHAQGGLNAQSVVSRIVSRRPHRLGPAVLPQGAGSTNEGGRPPDRNHHPRRSALSLAPGQGKLEPAASILLSNFPSGAYGPRLTYG